MTDTELREKEIALSKYLGYTIRAGINNEWYWAMKPDGYYVASHSFGTLAEAEAAFPHWSTDESFLSPLMKRLAEKGLYPGLAFCDGCGLVPDHWAGQLSIDRVGEWSAEGDSPIRALFEAAIQLPEVQAQR